MRIVDLLHRWSGGILGLVLAILGLSGAILVHKEEWITLPHANDAVVDDPARLGQLTARLLDREKDAQSIVFASDRFGLVQLRAGEGGLYATQSGEIVERWDSQWERPELWLFDLHHHLFAGDTGKLVAGISGLAAVLLAVTGSILWWRTRRTFRLGLLPRRWSGPAIRMHHRDIGIVSVPLVLLLGLTGAMIIFRPLAGFVLAPFGPPAAIQRELEAPRLTSSPLSANPDWPAMLAAAQREFPDARIRTLALPRKPGEAIAIRMKREGEWLPKGRTMVWFDAGTGKLLASRDALAMQGSTRAFNKVFPLHAGSVGGLPYRIALTLGGIAMFLLGLLTMRSFWFQRRRGKR